ncbi:MAG TPA: M48 family metalloprotease, partial [Candidatus Methanoperedens sp.]|nr:M48 family metalloprotease [Candidatus Methanoperedens sp.]
GAERAARAPAALCALALALAAACAAGPEPSRPRGPSPEEQDVQRRQEQVTAVGAAFPLLWEPEVLAELRAIGEEIARAVGASEQDFRYYVIDKPVLNAFTSPAGDIFFFTGQLAATRTRSELAGVFAHEIAHVQAGHYERLSRRVSLGTVPALAAIILSGGNPAVLYGTIALLESYQLAFSREMESEADRLSLVYLRQTSFDPRGLIGALRLIERGERLAPAAAPEGLRSHPLTASRINALQSGLGMPPGEEYRPAPDPAWDRVRAILVAGDDPAAALREFGARARTGGADDYDLLGVVHARRGDPAAAAEQFRLAVAQAPGVARYALDLAAALWTLGDGAGARAQIERAQGLPGGMAAALGHHLLGEISRAGGAPAEAIGHYRRATELAPQLPEAHYQLALGLSAAGALGEADYHFGRAAELRGDYLGALASYRRARKLLGKDPLWEVRLDAALRHLQ